MALKRSSSVRQSAGRRGAGLEGSGYKVTRQNVEVGRVFAVAIAPESMAAPAITVIEMLAGVRVPVPFADEPSAIEAFVASARACNSGSSPGELEVGRRLAEVGESSDALQAKTFDFKSSAGCKVAAIGPSRWVVVGSENWAGRRWSSTGLPTRGCGRPWNAPSTRHHLVVADAILAKTLTKWPKEVVLVAAADVAEGEDALFRVQIVELEPIHE